MSEDGINSGVRNIGRFFLYAIPYVLGLAAAIWLGVYIGFHDFRHQLSLEERAAVYTGAAERPKSKVGVEILDRNCVKITRADIDGTSLYLYARNDCHETLRYMEWHWQEVSPNGTALHEGYTNSCPVPVSYGDLSECSFTSYREIDSDDRTAKIKVWISR